MLYMSISTCFDYAVPIELQLPMIRKAGFNFVSIGADYAHSRILDKPGLYALKKYLSDSGLSVDVIHGYDLDKPDAIEVNKKLVDAAVFLEAPVIVLHCCPFTFDPSETDSRRRDLLAKLAVFEKLARDSSVRFAFENVLPGVATDLTEEIITISNPAYFGFCYDSSHDQIGGPRTFDLLQRLSDRLLTVHISDRIKDFVDHVVPGEGFIDFERICYLLHQAHISFPLLLEVKMTHSSYKKPEEFLNISYLEAEKLCQRIYEGKRQ